MSKNIREHFCNVDLSCTTVLCDLRLPLRDFLIDLIFESLNHVLDTLFIETVGTGFSLSAPIVIIAHSDNRFPEERFKETFRLIDFVRQLVMLIVDVVCDLGVAVPDSNDCHLIHDNQWVLLRVEFFWSPLDVIRPVAYWMGVSLVWVVLNSILVLLEGKYHPKEESIVARVIVHALLHKACDQGLRAPVFECSYPNYQKHDSCQNLTTEK